MITKLYLTLITLYHPKDAYDFVEKWYSSVSVLEIYFLLIS